MFTEDGTFQNVALIHAEGAMKGHYKQIEARALSLKVSVLKRLNEGLHDSAVESMPGAARPYSNPVHQLQGMVKFFSTKNV